MKRLLLGTWLWLCCATSAWSHAVGVSRGDYRVEGDRVYAALAFASSELAQSLPALDADGDGLINATELHSGRRLLRRQLLAGLRLQGAGAPCRLHHWSGELAVLDGLLLQLQYICAGGGPVELELGWLSQLQLGHRHLATRAQDPPGTVQVLFETANRLELSAETGIATSADTVGGMLRLGLEHIWTGYDHLLFLFGLVLLGGRVRDLLLTISCFTVAHSLTLLWVACGAFTPDPRWVEPAIALSIAWVGLENLRAKPERSAVLARTRWRSSFVFGLIHGLGFAGVLAEIALPPAQLLPSVLGFNLGVELGQILVLLAVLPVLAWLHRQQAAATSLRGLNLVVTCAGLGWFIARVG